MCVCVHYTFLVVPVVSMETRRLCMYEYYTVVLVPGDPLGSTVEISDNGIDYIQVICAFVRMNSM